MSSRHFGVIFFFFNYIFAFKVWTQIWEPKERLYNFLDIYQHFIVYRCIDKINRWKKKKNVSSLVQPPPAPPFVPPSLP